MTVLSGWLGAGKTTLLNRLLIETTERIAVIVNDVGDVNVDLDLIDHRGDGLIELTNGCVCCSIGGSLALTLRELAMRWPAPDRILVEASGIADPAKVVEYGDRRVVPIDAVITVADATDVGRRLADPTYGQLADRQLREADLILVAKLDLLPDELAGPRVADVATVYAPTPVIAVEQTPGWVVSVLTGATGSRSSEPTTSAQDRMQATRRTAAARRVGPPDHPGVVSATWTPSGPVAPRSLARVLANASATILRVKGILPTTDGDLVVVHLAGRRLQMEPYRNTAVASQGRLVVIGADPAGVETLLLALDHQCGLINE